MRKIIVHDNETKNTFYEMFDLKVPVITLPHGNVETFYKTFDNTTDSESQNFYHQMLPKLKRPIFLFMGPVKKYKGFGTLLSAIDILNKKKINYSMIVKDKIKEKRKNLYSLAVSPSYSKLGLIYRNTDAVIIPHTKISQSITLFEAGYFKKAVIVSNIGGLKETVRGEKDGFLFEKGAPVSLASKMENVIETTSNEMKTMGDNFKEHLIKQYSWDSITEKLIEIYQDFESLN
jgi:glycosyltransferase involved in cell wall biosynthesis